MCGGNERKIYVNKMNRYINVIYVYIYMGVSKNRGTPKWMVYKGKLY